jgi:hypothetical protein
MQLAIDDGWDADERWHELGANVDQCKINHLFYSYLGKSTPQPLKHEHFEDFAYTPLKTKGGYMSRHHSCDDFQPLLIDRA